MDIHFYAIYALSRAAAFSPAEAHIIASSSQYTDDSIYEIYPGLEPWKPVRTAHIGLETWSSSLQREVFMPFHFIPGGEGRGEERWITRAGSSLAETVLKAAIDTRGNSLYLFRLGIALHAYADTFSHQNFTGSHSRFNTVRDLHARNESKYWEMAQKRWHFGPQSPYKLLPKIGHGEAGKHPDIPYLEWSYRNHRGTMVHGSNPTRYIEALESICAQLAPLNKPAKIVPWSTLKKPCRNAITKTGYRAARVLHWKRAIRGSEFYHWTTRELFTMQYDRHHWRDAAIVPAITEHGLWQPRPTFNNSHWVRWHQAAAEHRQLVLGLL